MKSRLTTLDVCVLIAEIKRHAVGMRVKKVYDVNSKCFLVKLTESSDKVIIVIESGIRIHMSNYEWTKNKIPSNFTMRLRKFVDNRRLMDIQQIGCDRMVKLTFGSGDFTVHLIIELYDRGNIILTDQNSVIIDILRKRDDGETPLTVHSVYPTGNAINKSEHQIIDVETLNDYFGKLSRPTEVLKVFSHDFVFSNVLFKLMLSRNNVDPKLKIDSSSKLDIDLLQKIFNAFHETNKICVTLKSGLNTRGYILYSITDDPDQKHYNDFHVLPNENNVYTDVLCDQKNILYFDSFNKTVDEFFKHAFEQKSITQETNVRKKANKKLTNVKNDQEKRLEALVAQQESMFLRAKLIENNTEIVEKCIALVQDLLNEVNWQVLEELLKKAKSDSQNSDNSLCSIISKPNYASKSITLELKFPGEVVIENLDSNIATSKARHRHTTLVEVFLDLNGFANAKYYYDKRKKMIEKYEKTKESLSAALKSAEKKKLLVLKKEKIATFVQKNRKIYWFENYFWFISSDNVLVVGGRDAQQNERLVKRYMRDNDLFFHADLHGASIVIARLPRSENSHAVDQVFTKTVEQAALFAVCHSSAWDNHLAIQAYWVHANQVSKTPPSGEHVPTGSFIISGQKNFVSPSQLTLGFGVLFMSQTNLQTFNQVTPNSTDNIVRDKHDEVSCKDNDLLIAASSEAPKNSPVEERTSVADLVNENQISTEHEKIPVRCADNEPTDDILSPNPTATIQMLDSELSSISLEMIDNPKPINTNLTKFQRNKLKKIKKKYSNQDIEDKLAAIEKSHTPERITKKHIKLQKKTEEQKKLSEQRQKILAKKKAPPKKVKTSRQTNNDMNDDNDNKMYSTTEDEIINYLSFCIEGDDQVEFILPVCGPYSSMSKYKYKVKLTPGTERRGSAFKKMITIFIGKAKEAIIEKTAISSLKGTDLCRNMPQNVKISHQK